MVQRNFRTTKSLQVFGVSRKKQLIQDKFWKSEKEFFYDLNHNTTEFTAITSLVGITPLFLNITTDEQA